MGSTILQVEYSNSAVTCRFTKRNGGYFRWQRLVDEFHDALLVAIDHFGLRGLIQADARLGTGQPVRVPLRVFKRALSEYRKLPVVQAAEAEGGLTVEGGREMIRALKKAANEEATA